jgi:hypothetical protein
MHCLMLPSSRRWLCALSGSVRGRISELMLSKGATLCASVDDTPGAFRSFLRQLCLPYRGYAFVPVSFEFFLFRAIKCSL